MNLVKVIQAIIVLGFLVALGIFAASNTGPLTVHFLSYSTTAPAALLTVGIYLLGMLTGWTLVAFLRRSIRAATKAPTE